jgi:hypothetical protein
MLPHVCWVAEGETLANGKYFVFGPLHLCHVGSQRRLRKRMPSASLRMELRTWAPSLATRAYQPEPGTQLFGMSEMV